MTARTNNSNRNGNGKCNGKMQPQVLRLRHSQKYTSDFAQDDSVWWVVLAVALTVALVGYSLEVCFGSYGLRVCFVD
jgi:hypothetical protein